MDKIWSLQSAGLAGQKSKITATGREILYLQVANRDILYIFYFCCQNIKNIFI